MDKMHYPRQVRSNMG